MKLDEKMNLDEDLLETYMEGVFVLRNAVEAMYDSWVSEIVYGNKEDYKVIFDNVYTKKGGVISGHSMQRGSVLYTLKLGDDSLADICTVHDDGNPEFQKFSMSVDANNKIILKKKKAKKSCV